MISIGIDPGKHTGVAVWNGKEFLEMKTLLIHQAMKLVEVYAAQCGNDMKVYFEDARLRTWYGNCDTSAKLQGAGSIKRDCIIWEDFLTDLKIPYKATPPMPGGTKLSPDYFKVLSGWSGKTSNHARDAAILVIGK